MLKFVVLRRDDVIAAAVELLDEVGLDGFTTRALTDRLGVRPGALYWHVRSKDELLAAIADRIMASVYQDGNDAHGGEPPRDWAGQAAGFGRRMRAAMLAHRDGARVVAGYVSMNEATMSAAETGLAMMRAAGMSLAQAAYFGDAISSYVTGFVLQEQAVPAAGTTAPEIEPARYPNLSAWEKRRAADQDTAFEAGLALIVRGMRAILAEA